MTASTIPTRAFNDAAGAEVNAHMHLPVTIVDVTLREGQQAAEVAFSVEESVEVARALERIGVPVVQVGYAGEDDATLRAVRAACPSLRLAALVVGWKPDAERAMRSAREAGADVCSILFRSTDAHLANLDLTRDQAIHRVAQLAALATADGWPEVIFGPSFSTMSDPELLFALYGAALDSGATVISLADSLGVARPDAVRRFVAQMRERAGDRGVRVHMHDDFGLALANTLAAVEAGADWVEVSVNGLGERAGNCALEQFVTAMQGLYGIDAGVRASGLGDVARLVARLTGVPIPPMSPVTGENVFANKLEIHVRAAASDPSLMEPYDPALVGNRRWIKLGRGTGPTGVRTKAAQLGISLDDATVTRLVAEINRRATRTKRAVGDDEFLELAR